MSKSFFLISTIIILFSCQTTKKDKEEIDFDSYEVEKTATKETKEYIKEAKFVFYNMSSPLDMADVFKNSGKVYNEEILLDENKYTEFTSSINISIILGMYGVDLSYARMFDQTQLSVKYLAVIKKLAEKLGVPENYVSLTAANIENNINNRDSLYRIANEAYLGANTYLKGNNRESAVSLILMGSWIETLYIATALLDLEKPNKALVKKISDQKYSLNSLITLLKNNADDLQINEFIELLNSLKVEFENLTNPITDDFDGENPLPDGEEQIKTEYVKKFRSRIFEIRNSITL